MSPSVAPFEQPCSALESILTISGDTTQDLDSLPSTIRPSNAPPSSPTSSSEPNTWSLLPRQAKVSSSRCPPLIYFYELLGNVRPQTYQGELLDLGREQAGRRPSFEPRPYDNQECTRAYDFHCQRSSHDGEATIVDPYSRVQSACSEADTVHENKTSKDISLGYYAKNTASLDSDYRSVPPTDLKSLRSAMPSPRRRRGYRVIIPEKPYGEARRNHGLSGSPSIPARSRQISLPILGMPSIGSTMNPQTSASTSTRAQSWHAAPRYSPSRRPPEPPPDMEKSIFEDYDEDDHIEQKRVANRLRHLIRRLHCG